MPVTGTYDSYLVALSFAVASFASYTALDLSGRIRASKGRATVAWLVTAAIAMGSGIWSMHFIAMLAFLMPMPVSYDVGLTVLPTFKDPDFLAKSEKLQLETAAAKSGDQLRDIVAHAYCVSPQVKARLRGL